MHHIDVSIEKDVFDANNKLAEHATGDNVSVTEKTITVVDQNNQPVYLNSSAASTGYTVNCYSNDKSANAPVIAYGLK